MPPDKNDALTDSQRDRASAKRQMIATIFPLVEQGLPMQEAAVLSGLSSSAISKIIARAPVSRGERITTAEKCRRILALPLDQLAPGRAKGVQSQYENLAKLPAVRQELHRIYMLTIGASSEYMAAGRRSGSAALTLERFADCPLCPPPLAAKLRTGSKPTVLMRVIRSITAELEARHRGQSHYELSAITGRRTLEIEAADGTKEPMLAGRTWVFDDMSTNVPFWFEAPADAGSIMGLKKLVERHGCAIGRQGLYAWDWGSSAWMGMELVGRVRDAYTADIILRFFRRLMQTYGKPDTIVLEKSVWKARSIDGFEVRGAEPEAEEIVPEKFTRPAMEEAEKALLQDGLRALGIRMIYTWTPRGKPIEGAFNYLQRVFPTFLKPGEGVNIGRYAGEFERSARRMRQGGDGVKHPAELGFIHIDRHADVSWEAMQWINGRHTDARNGKPIELLTQALTAAPLPPVTEQDLACFLPDMRELMIRGGHVLPTVNGQVLAFIHPEHFAELGDGYLVSVKFDRAEPTLGAAIYNRDTSSRNFKGYRLGQFICWAVLHSDAPAISLRDREEDQGRQLIARYKLFHRNAYRALDLPKQKTVQISERRDGAGNSVTVQRGGASSAPINPRSVRDATPTPAPARNTDLPFAVRKLLETEETT